MKAMNEAKKVLLVDANAKLLRLLCTMIARHGHEVRVATTGGRALRDASELRPDVIFTGMLLPDCSGIDLAARLRAMPELAHTFIVALTGYSTLDCACSKVGFDYRMVKPVSIDEMIETITLLTHGSTAPIHELHA